MLHELYGCIVVMPGQLLKEQARHQAQACLKRSHSEQLLLLHLPSGNWCIHQLDALSTS